MIVKKKNGLFIEPYVSPYPPPSTIPTSNDASSGNKAENNNNNNDNASLNSGGENLSSSSSSSRDVVSSRDPEPGLIAVTEIIDLLIDNITDTLTVNINFDKK